MAKRKLISEPALFPDLIIIGISSQLKDYRLAFHINRESDLSLIKNNDLPVFDEKEEKLIEYPLFTFHEVERRIHYYLIGNNNSTIKMISAYKQADFIFMLKGQPDKEKKLALISVFRNISGIQLVFPMENEKIKNLDGIMSDLELHLVKK
ncbi:MAG: IPExxxVDY family protein [Lentimicrobium sp.]